MVFDVVGFSSVSEFSALASPLSLHLRFIVDMYQLFGDEVLVSLVLCCGCGGRKDLTKFAVVGTLFDHLTVAYV